MRGIVLASFKGGHRHGVGGGRFRQRHRNALAGLARVP